MSDDTPTQKFDQPGADAPTEVIGGPPAPPADGSAAATAAGDPKSRRLIIILASIGGALLLAVLILLIVLLTQGSRVPTPGPTPTGSASGSPTPTPSPTPSKTPTPTPTPTPTKTVDPPPPDNSARINSFTVGNDEVFCNTSAPVPSPQYISFSWSASNVDQVFFGVNTKDASQGFLFNNLPPSGDTSNFPAGYDPFEFPCPTDSVEYTLTVIGGGKKVSESVTVTNVGDN